MLSTLINLLCLLTPLILAQDDDTLEPIDRTLPKVITDWDTEPDAELRKWYFYSFWQMHFVEITNSSLVLISYTDLHFC